MKKNFFETFVIVLFMLVNVGCWTSPDAGKVEVQSVYGKVTKVVRSPGIWTVFVLGDEYYEVDMTQQNTGDLAITSMTKDRAAFTWNVRASFLVINEDQAVINYVNKFGFDNESRQKKVLERIYTQVQADVGDVSNQYDTTEIVASTDVIQKAVTERIKTYLKDQLFVNLESLQLIGKPDFVNNSIDNGPSEVIAARLRKIAEEENLKADQIATQRKAEIAKSFANPKNFELELLDRQVRVAEAWAKHNGPLVFGGNNTPLTLSK